MDAWVPRGASMLLQVVIDDVQYPLGLEHGMRLGHRQKMRLHRKWVHSMKPQLQDTVAGFAFAGADWRAVIKI